MVCKLKLIHETDLEQNLVKKRPFQLIQLLIDSFVAALVDDKLKDTKMKSCIDRR